MDETSGQVIPPEGEPSPQPIPVPVQPGQPGPVPVSPVPASPQPVQQNGEQKPIRQLPGYQLLEVLGAGSMAVVYKCRQLSLDRIVAIKILPLQLSQDKEYVERFYQEGQAAAKLNHPNIVSAFDVGEHGGYHYFVMEYVEGKTVDEEIKAGKVYSESEALSVILQVAKALQHAHNQGMIHRDVKPKNIMITEDGIAKLMDMGLARVADDAEAIEAESGKLFGTPYYISPEQIKGKKDVDFRCDIYSLGVTLFHMVTGQVPFEGEDSKAVMVKHIKEPPPSPDRFNLDLSFGLCKTIMQMMAKKREMRFDSTEELIEELQSIEFLLEVEGDKPAPIPKVEHHPHSNRGSKAAVKKVPQNQPERSTMFRHTERVYNPVNLYLLLALGASVLINILLILKMLM